MQFGWRSRPKPANIDWRHRHQSVAREVRERICSSASRCFRGVLCSNSSVQRPIWLSNFLVAPAGGVLPPSQIARRSRRRSTSEIMISLRRPACRSSATASRLIAAGPAPARTAARTAPADGNSSTGGACCTSTPNARRNATASESRMPARGSRHTSGVCANSSALTARDCRAHS
jgi:hypothetical protein